MKNIKEIKTSILGLVLFSVAAADLWHFEKMDTISHAVLGVVGILFLFAPDKILNILIKKAEK